MPEPLDLAALAKDIHKTIRREIVAGLGPSFAPHRSGNLLDKFLAGYDKNALAMILETMGRVQAKTREADAELLDDLARDAEKTPGVTSQEQALMKGAVAAYRSGAAALRA